MNIKIIFTINILIIAFIGCKSTPVTVNEIWVTPISDSVIRYYIPATVWQEKNSHSVICRPDMTYLNEHGRKAVFNISFFNKDTPFNEVSSVYFSSDSKNFNLDDINAMFARVDFGELRITSLIALDDIINLFNSEKYLLFAVIDSVEYSFEPDKNFLQFQKQFLEQVILPD
ncbi:MAG: hypothetical protein FWC19_01650 [Treponema sp.]|nr:hypothetical protein [Treponema sp.]MCL2271497.1 hypothetical protein [Treponema sp.]